MGMISFLYVLVVCCCQSSFWISSSCSSSLLWSFYHCAQLLYFSCMLHRLWRRSFERHSLEIVRDLCVSEYCCNVEAGILLDIIYLQVRCLYSDVLSSCMFCTFMCRSFIPYIYCTYYSQWWSLLVSGFGVGMVLLCPNMKTVLRSLMRNTQLVPITLSEL